MKSYIEERVKKVATHILKTKATVRQAAKVFGVSKSTISRDISERLLELDPRLYTNIKKITTFNLLERHIRGGAATARKYKMMCN